MPIYEYRCHEEACKAEYEDRRSMSAMDETRACPTCGSLKTERKVSMSFAYVGSYNSTDAGPPLDDDWDEAGLPDDFEFGDF